MDIYTRLYKYRDTPSKSAAENFLTEALADIFNRLPIPIRTEFLIRMLPETCSDRLRHKCKDGKQIEAITQVSIDAAGSRKVPDIIVYLDSAPLVLFEVKVYASLQMHRLGDSPANEPALVDIGQTVFQDQLETYSQWISSKCSGGWAGAVVLLTHGTPAPAGFEDDGHGGNSVIGSTRTWKDVATWFANNLDLNQSQTTHCALASDLNHFLEENRLMANFISSSDLAATALFIPAQQALKHTFRTVIKAVASKYQRSKGGNIGSDFWSGGNLYWTWYNLNKELNPTGSQFYIAIGICFPNHGAFGSTDPVGLPKHEPFFFVEIADEKGRNKASDLLSKIPDGWKEIRDDFSVIITKTVSRFDPDPDLRVQSLIVWAQTEVGRAVACIPNYEAAPIQVVPEDAED